MQGSVCALLSRAFCMLRVYSISVFVAVLPLNCAQSREPRAEEEPQERAEWPELMSST